MKKYFILVLLALLTITCAVIEGLTESLPPQFIQISGLLIIVCAVVFIAWTLKVRSKGFYKDEYLSDE